MLACETLGLGPMLKSMVLSTLPAKTAPELKFLEAVAIDVEIAPYDAGAFGTKDDLSGEDAHKLGCQLFGSRPRWASWVAIHHRIEQGCFPQNVPCNESSPTFSLFGVG